MAAQARLAATDSGNESDDARLVAVRAVPLCLLHDLVGAAAYLASHPLHAAYLLFFARHLACLAAFFCPLLVSTALLLAVLATAGPYLAGGGAEWPPGVRSLGRTCGITVAALCAELRPPDGGGAGLVGQLCSFVLGPSDAASVYRVGEIMGELCDVTGSYCFVLQEQEELGGEDLCSKELAFVLPLLSVGDDAIVDERSFLDSEEGKDKIDEKAVISEDLKGGGSVSLDEYQREERFVQEMRAEDEREVVIQERSLMSSPDMDGVIEEKRLECDPVSVEIKKCEPVQETELDVKKCEPVHPAEPMKQRSSIAQRIKLWEAQLSGNFNKVTQDNKDDISAVKFSPESESVKDVKKSVRFESDPYVDTNDRKLQALEQDHGEEFKDVMECVPSEKETFSETCSQNLQAEENAPASHTEGAPEDVQPEAEFLEQECRAEQDMQDCKAAQPEHDLQEKEYEDVVAESPVACNEREKKSLKSASIAGRVHSRTSSDNLISEGSPSQKEKEWKRTLACKLYEERMQLKLCRDRAVVEGSSDNMDMLWEAYEVGGSGSGRMHGGMKVKSSRNVEELVEEEEEEERDDDDDDEGSVRQLCCLQALKFSTNKMSFRGGKPSLAKISKVLKGMAALSRVGSRRSHKG